MSIVKVRKQGNSLYLCIPALVCKRAVIKNGDCFRLERDSLLPNVFTLEKLSNNNDV